MSFGRSTVHVRETGGHAWTFEADSDRARREAEAVAKDLGRLLERVTIVDGDTQRDVAAFTLDESGRLCEVYV